MTQFVMLDGNIVIADRFVCGPKIPDGHSWRNNESVGEKPIWTEIAFPVDSIDPNHETLFGYETKVFMAKQYK